MFIYICDVHHSYAVSEANGNALNLEINFFCVGKTYYQIIRYVIECQNAKSNNNIDSAHQTGLTIICLQHQLW